MHCAVCVQTHQVNWHAISVISTISIESNFSYKTILSVASSLFLFDHTGFMFEKMRDRDSRCWYKMPGYGYKLKCRSTFHLCFFLFSRNDRNVVAIRSLRIRLHKSNWHIVFAGELRTVVFAKIIYFSF